MSIKIMAAVWESAPVDSGKLLVLLALADHARDDGSCWPAVSTIASKARLSTRQTQRALSELEQAGLISREMGAGPHGVSVIRIRAKTLKQGGDNMSGGVTPMSGGETPMTRRGDAHVTQTVKNRYITPHRPSTVCCPITG